MSGSQFLLGFTRSVRLTISRRETDLNVVDNDHGFFLFVFVFRISRILAVL